MKRLCHWLAHKLGWQFGHLIALETDDGGQLLGFMCDTCGAITNVFEPLYSQIARASRRYL